MRLRFLLFAGCFIFAFSWVPPTFAAEPPGSAANPNAAVIYWQAFAAMPTLVDEQRQKLDAATKSTTAPLMDDVRPVLALFDEALRQLHRASLVQSCDWQLDYEAGPHMQLPHLQKARELARVALLRARLRFAAGETVPAVADVLAVLKMGRDCGVSPLLISFLVDAAIEKIAIEVLAANLPSLKPEQLDPLAASLHQLPSPTSVATCIQWEAHTFGGLLERFVDAEIAKVNDPQAGSKVIAAIQKQLGGEGEEKPKADDAEGTRRHELLQSMTVADVRESVRRLRADYEEMAKIASLSPADQAQRWAEFDLQMGAARTPTKHDEMLRYFSVSFLPAIRRVYERGEQMRVQRHLLDLAVQVQRHGPDVLKSAKAFGDGKTEYRKTDGSYDLHYQFASSDKTVVLTVGTKK